MAVLAIGIDDTATATQKSEGWGYIILPKASVSVLEKAAGHLSATPFHANRCKKRNIGKYERFLTAIRDVVGSSEPSLLAQVFDDPSWHVDLGHIAQTTVQAGQIQFDPAVEAALHHVTSPLMTLQRLTADRNLTKDLVEVWLDENGETQGFSAMKVGTRPVPITAVAYSK